MVASSILCLAIMVTGQQRVDPARLVGLWEVVKGNQPPVGSTLEFSRDGQFKATIKGLPISFTGEFKLEGDQLTLTPPGSAMTVSELTRDKLAVEGKGSTMEYKRMGAVAAAMPRAAPKSQGTNRGNLPRAKAKGAGVGGAATKWVVVKSEEDGFTVEMPGQPNGHDKESGGGFEIHTTSYQTPISEYLVMAVHGPTEVPKAEAAKALEKIRAKAASKIGANLTMISEDTTQLGDIEGLAFQFAIDKPTVGSVDGVGRGFIKGKTIYVLLAFSNVRNQGDPEDADKFANSFVLSGGGREPIVKAGVAKGATRKPGPNPLKTWGTEVDPEGDVVLKASGSSLSMEIPGTPHLLAPERDRMNAPRILAPARGDFVVTVRVDGAFQPTDKSTVKGLSSRQAGGLIVWKDAKNYLVFQRRASVGDEGKDTNQAVLEELVAGSKGATHRPAAPEGPLYLRLERKRGRIEAAFSANGRDWKEVKPVETTWAEGEVQVGVVAVNTDTGPHVVTFDGYSLKAK